MSVNTHPAVHVDSQTRRALAAEGALGVDAAAVHTNAWSQTFINISAIAAVRRKGETRFANTLEAAIFVNAHAIETHVGGGTFIMINAVLSIRSQLKAGVADALKTSLCVDTAAIAAHHPVHNAFININAGLFGGSSLVTFMTLAVI